MFIYYYTLLGASVLSVTFGELNETASPQSYDSEDEALPYKYTFLHIYTSPKPGEHHHRNSRHQFQRTNFQPQIPHQLENFPLKTHAHDYHNTEADTSNYNEKPEKNLYFQSDQTHKTCKEPQVIPKQAPINFRSHSVPHVRGHNINVQEFSNNFFQNGYYPNNPNLLDKNHYRQANFFFEPRFSYKKETNTLPPSTKATQMYFQPNPVLAHQYPQDVIKYNRNMQPGKKENPLQSNYHEKPLINFARVKNVAHAPLKASFSVKSDHKKIPTLHHQYFSHSHDLQKKTKLLPVERKNIYLNYYSV